MPQFFFFTKEFSLPFHNTDEVSRLRELANYQSGIGSSCDILTWAQVAGAGLKKPDFDRFLGIVKDFPDNPYRAEAILTLIRLLIESGNFNEARQFAADLWTMEHTVFHAMARARIARFSMDAEDNALAFDFIKELVDSYREAE